MGRELEGKVSLITGAGCGIGREMAKLLARKGLSLVLVNHFVKPTESVAAEVARDCHRMLAYFRPRVLFHRRGLRWRWRPYGWLTCRDRIVVPEGLAILS